MLAEPRATPIDLPIEIVFIQPIADPTRRCIFERFATHVELRRDPFSRRFAEALRGWVVPAATRAPT